MTCERRSNLFPRERAREREREFQSNDACGKRASRAMARDARAREMVIYLVCHKNNNRCGALEKLVHA